MSGYELAEEIADFFSYDIIGICGCGCPEDTLLEIRYYLQYLDVRRKDDYEGAKKILKDRFGVEYVSQNGLLQFMAYIIDNKGLSDHGGSILGAWITDFGRMCLYVYGFIDFEEELEDE